MSLSAGKSGSLVCPPFPPLSLHVHRNSFLCLLTVSPPSGSHSFPAILHSYCGLSLSCNIISRHDQQSEPVDHPKWPLIARPADGMAAAFRRFEHARPSHALALPWHSRGHGNASPSVANSRLETAARHLLGDATRSNDVSGRGATSRARAHAAQAGGLRIDHACLERESRSDEKS